MSNMRIGMIALAVAMLVSAPVLADFSENDWQFYKEIKPPAKAANVRYAQVALDREANCNSMMDLADVRIVESDSTEAPYKVIVDKGRIEHTGYQVKLLNKSAVPGQYVQFVLDLGKPGHLNNRLDIETYSQNFTQRVEVDGSQNGVNWVVLRNNAYIFDFTRDYQAKSTMVSYPQNNYRYLRVKAFNYDQKPIQVNDAVVYLEKEQKAVEEVVYSGPGTVTQNPQEKTTEILLDLGCNSLPSGRIVITSPDVNYHRYVEVYSSKDKKQWTWATAEQIINYDTPKFKSRDEGISYNSIQGRYLQLKIQNRDDRPIRISSVKVLTDRRRLFFPYKQGSEYRLYYGNEYAKTPMYDIEETFKYLSSQKSPTLALSPQEKNLQYARAIASEPWLRQNRWVLWGVLIVAVALLALLTVRMIVQTKQSGT